MRSRWCSTVSGRLPDQNRVDTAPAGHMMGMNSNAGIIERTVAVAAPEPVQEVLAPVGSFLDDILGGPFVVEMTRSLVADVPGVRWCAHCAAWMLHAVVGE